MIIRMSLRIYKIMKQREIKFRAWDGSKMQYDFGYINVTSGNAVTWSEDEYKNWIVMQFTGLKDKNGKEIYEDDIIKYSDKTYAKNDIIKYKVIYRQGIFMIGNEQPLCYGNKSIEIIGNIYENKDLLK